MCKLRVTGSPDYFFTRTWKNRLHTSQPLNQLHYCHQISAPSHLLPFYRLSPFPGTVSFQAWNSCFSDWSNFKVTGTADRCCLEKFILIQAQALHECSKYGHNRERHNTLHNFSECWRNTAEAYFMFVSCPTQCSTVWLQLDGRLGEWTLIRFMSHMLQHGMWLFLPQHGRGGEPHLPALKLSVGQRAQGCHCNAQVRWQEWSEVSCQRLEGEAIVILDSTEKNVSGQPPSQLWRKPYCCNFRVHCRWWELDLAWW